MRLENTLKKINESGTEGVYYSVVEVKSGVSCSYLYSSRNIFFLYKYQMNEDSPNVSSRLLLLSMVPNIRG